MKNCIIKDKILIINGLNIGYDIMFSDRKSLALSLRSDSEKLIVKLPNGLNISEAEKLITSKISWILKHKNKIKQRKETRIKRVYADGAIHLLFGNPYKLKVVEGGKNDAWLDSSNNTIVIQKRKNSSVENILSAFYTNQASNILPQITSKMAIDFRDRNKVYPISLSLKRVKSYWGLCSTRGKITLNIELVRAPIKCVEFIIKHELCHLIHANHSREFYDLLDKEMPDWKNRKEILTATISCYD